MATTGSLSRSRGGPADTLLELPVAFKTRQGARDVASELTKAQEQALRKARKRQEKEQERSVNRAQKAQEELIERRRRLAVAAIKDETKRRRASIEAEYKDERRRVKALLRERLDANEIAAKDYKRQLDNFDRDLRARRDRQLSNVPSDTLKGRANQLLGDQFGGRAGGLGSLVGGRAALAIGGGVVVGGAALKGLKEAVALASTFEDELVEVRKTTGLTNAELDALGGGILDLAQRTGIAQNELAAITAVAGQLGVKGRADLLAFTETVAKFAAVTELSSEQAAESLAKTGRAFGIPVEQLENLASAANELSNTTAARAGDVLDVLQRVGASGSNIGLTADQVAGLAATLIDAGVESERAGTSLRNVFTLLLTEAGKVADTVGVTEAAFRDMIDADALGAIQLYLGKLNELDAQTRAIEIEGVFGQENVLQVTTLATQVDQLNVNLDTSREAFEAGTSLSTEFEASLDALSAQWAIFTATITKAATEVGQAVIPALTALLEVVNALTGGGADAGEAFRQADAEIGRLQGVERAIDRYDELADKTNRTSAENDELKRLTKELAGEYPQFVSATDAAGSAMRVYSDDIRSATQAVRELRAEEQLRAVEQLGADLAEARRRQEQAESLRNSLQDERRRSLGDRGRAPLRAGAGTGGQALSSEDLERRAAAAQQTIRSSAGEASAALDELANVFVTFGDDAARTSQVVAKLEAQGVSAGQIAAAQGRAALFASSSPATAPGDTTPRTPRPPGGGGSGDSASDREAKAAEKEAERKRKAQLDAFESLNTLVAGITANRQDEELERAIANLQVETDAKVEKIKEVAAEALKGDALTADQRAQTEASSAAAVLQLREIQAREEQKLRDDAAKKRADEEAKAAAQRLGLTRAVADAERAVLDQTTADRIAAIEDPHERELATIEETARAERAAIAATYEFELAAIAASTETAEEKALRRQALRLQLEADLAKVASERVERTAEAEEEADEERRRRIDGYVREVQRATDVVVDELFASFGGSDELAQAEVELQRASFLEQEKALDESLRRRQLSREEHATALKEIELSRAQFERDVQDQNAGFFARSYQGLRDVALAAIRDQLAEFVAAKAVELVTHTTTEGAKTAATEAGTATRIVSLVAEKAQSLITAGAAMVEAVAKFIADAVSKLGLFSIVAIPAGLASLVGLYKGAKSALGFASGGFVGRPGERGHDEVPIVVGRGEAILNHHQQAVVDDSLRRSGRGGLAQLFRTESRPHYRYATGGFAGFEPVLASPASNGVRGGVDRASSVADPGRAIAAAVSDAVRPLADEVARLKTEPPDVYADPKTFRRGITAAARQRTQARPSQVRRIRVETR